MADVSANASPTAQAVLLAQPSSTIAPSAPSGGHRVVALHPVEAPAVAADRVDGLLLAERERAVLVDRRDVHAGARERLADRRVVGDQPSAPVTTYSAAIRSSSEARVVSFRPAATTVTR